MKNILILVSVVFVCSCGNGDKTTYSEQTKRLLFADPEMDFRSAIEARDYRFMGVYGYSISSPGVSITCVDPGVDIKPIEGTSDATDNYEARLFNAVARVYAKEYNFKMKMYLRENRGFECSS